MSALLCRLLPLLLIAAVTSGTVIAAEPTAKDIIARADAKRRGKTSQGTMTMSVVRPDWKRTMEMKMWSLGSDYTLVVITAPAKDKGQAFLKRKNEMWNYMPSIDRVIKLPPSMMGQSWMGSDFTNDDLVKESSMVQDYAQKLLGEETVSGYPSWKIELLPKEDAAVVWGKLLVWVTKEHDCMVKVERYDEDGVLMSTETADDIGMVGGRMLPRRMTMVPTDKKGNSTVLEMGSDTKFDIPIDESFFSQQQLKRAR